MIPPSSLAKLVVGYLEEEGLQKTLESFYQECRDTDEPSDPFAQPPSLKAILEEYVGLKESVSNSDPEAVVFSLWKNLDVLIAQLKYHTIPHPKPLITQKSQRKKFNDRFRPIRAKSRPVPKNKPKASSATKNAHESGAQLNAYSNTTQQNDIQTVQPVFVTGMLAPVGSPSKWQSVSIPRGESNVPIHQDSLGLNMNQNGSVRNNRDQNGSPAITRDQNGSARMNRDHSSLEIISSQQGSEGIATNTQTSEGINSVQPRLFDIPVSSNVSANKGSSGIRDQRTRDLQQSETITRDQQELSDPSTQQRSEEISDQYGSVGIVTNIPRSFSQSSGPCISATATTLSSENVHVNGSSTSSSSTMMECTLIPTSDSVQNSDIPCIEVSEMHMEMNDNIIQTGSSHGVALDRNIHGIIDSTSTESVVLSSKSPKRKGHPPKKRHITNPSPAKAIPLDSFLSNDTDYLQQLIDGEKIADAAMPFFLDAFLNTPILQEKLAENINKVVGSSKPSDVTEEVITEAMQKPSTSTQDDIEQNIEVPVEDILSLLEADPVFESFFSMLGTDVTKTVSPNKDTQSFPSCTSSEPVPTSTTMTCTTNQECMSATSLVTESLLLLSSSPPKLSTLTTTVTPALESTIPVVKPLTPEDNAQQTLQKTTVDIKQAETEIHVRSLFSNKEKPAQDKDKPDKIPIRRSKKKPVSPSKRIRAAKKPKKKIVSTPNRKLLLPNTNRPLNDLNQPAVRLLQNMASGHPLPPALGYTPIMNTVNRNGNLNGNMNSNLTGNLSRNPNGNPNGILNGIRKTGGTMLQMLQDAATMQKVQGMQGCNSVLYQPGSQITLPQHGNNGNYVQNTMATTGSPPQIMALNLPVGSTLPGNSPVMGVVPSMHVLQPHQNKLTQQCMISQHADVPFNPTLSQSNTVPQISTYSSAPSNVMQQGGVPSACSSAQIKVLPQICAPKTCTSAHSNVMPQIAVPKPSTSVYSSVMPQIAVPKPSTSVYSNVMPQIVAPNTSTLPQLKEFPSLNPASLTQHFPLYNYTVSTPVTSAHNETTGNLGSLTQPQQALSTSYSTSRNAASSFNNKTMGSGNQCQSMPVVNNLGNSGRLIDRTSPVNRTSPVQTKRNCTNQNTTFPSNRMFINTTVQEKARTVSPVQSCSDLTSQTSLSSNTIQTSNNASHFQSISRRNSQDSNDTIISTTPQKQLLITLAQTPGQSSTESSPLSKTAEDCVSSFCRISNQGAMQLNIQNNSCVMQDGFNSDRNSSSLATAVDNKIKNKRLGERGESRRELIKDYSDKDIDTCTYSSHGDKYLSHVGDEASTSAISTDTGKESTNKQGQKRCGSFDLKENKPKKFKSSKTVKKSKAKRDLPKHFDVDKFLSRLHYIEK